MKDSQETVSSVDNKIFQEFYCRESGGGCGGYITVKLNMSLNGRIKVICPKCKHEHERMIQKGRIIDDTGRGKSIVEELMPTLAAWSKTARADISIRKKNEKDKLDEFENGNAIILDHAMRELWFKTHGATK